ncbi:MAG: VWA domain-containing protein [Chloroflexi bacterium]|nr:VWA domain-containing protein [Chloroflexota bacterium]
MDGGWNIAEQFHEAQHNIPSPELRAKAAEIAAKAILLKASRVLGASHKAAKTLREPYSTPGRGELALDETLENLAGKPAPEAHDVIVQVRERKRVSAVLMVDTSLSMTGKNLALAGVAAAVLAGKLEPEDYALVLFESTATVAKPMNQRLHLQQVVTKILEVPALGYTNIEDALAKGLTELAKGRQRERFGIIITDGKYTVGEDPLPLAAKYPRLFVLATEDYKMDRDLCRALAARGHGRSYPVDDYAELPWALSSLLNEVLR